MEFRYDDLPDSFFEAASGDERQEISRPSVSRGYFRDALCRTMKRAAAKVGAGIIICIALISLLAPIFIKRPSSLMDPYYSKLPPRIGGVPFMDGGVTRRLGDRGLARLLSIAIGADAAAESWGEARGGEYDPIISVGDTEGRTRKVRVDAYLEVGFVYKVVERDEYQRMLLWESETGRKIFYPLVDDNEYCPDPNDANLWYKVEPGSGEALTASASDELEGFAPIENYLKDADGEPVYTIPTGGGDTPGGYRVRVLYLNYYRYKTGEDPNYLFGTDSQGYDLALRVSGGIAVSLALGIAVSVINFIIGAFVGAIEGYYGGAVDLALERLTDILSGVPFIVVATLFQIYLADKAGAIFSLLFAFVLTGWLGTAGRVRAQFYRFKGAEYVLAAKSMGVSDRRIIWRHIFPNTLGTVITSSALVIPGVIFTESMLSFLGIVNLGGEGLTSLGTLLSDASGIWVRYPHLMLFPAVVISLLMIAFNLLGGALREGFDPEMKGGV